MSPYEVLERAGSVRDRVSGRPRISVTELSRSKDWRDRLPKVGAIEITDRGDTAGWLLSAQDMEAIIEGYSYLEEEVERAQIAAIFGARRGSRPLSGEALKDAVGNSFEVRRGELRGVLDAD